MKNICNNMRGNALYPNNQDTLLFQAEQYSVVFNHLLNAVQIIASEQTDLNRIYNSQYYTGSYLEKKEKRETLYKEILKKALIYSKGPLLDIGSGAGLFLKEVMAVNVECTGIEPSEAACSLAVQQSSAEILNCDPLDLPDNWRPGHYKIITILDVLAHTVYPDKLLKWCYNQLDRNGILIVKTPNHPEAFYRYIGKKYNKNSAMFQSLAHIPYQNFGWDIQGLQTFIVHNGFEVIETEPFHEFEQTGTFRFSDLWHPRRLLYKSRLRDAEKFLSYASIFLIAKKA